MTATASTSGILRACCDLICPQNLHPELARTELRDGLGLFPQAAHRHGHGESAPGYGIFGSSPAARMIRTASAGSSTWPAQLRHPCPLRAVLKLGADSKPHTVHRHFQGTLAPGYGTRGSKSAKRITATASSGMTVFPLQ